MSTEPSKASAATSSRRLASITSARRFIKSKRFSKAIRTASGGVRRRRQSTPRDEERPDQALLPPKVGAQVLIGGAEGVVLPGTGKYANAGGAYSTRLKLESDEFGAIVYYDDLFFRFREVKLD